MPEMTYGSKTPYLNTVHFMSATAMHAIYEAHTINMQNFLFNIKNLHIRFVVSQNI